MTYQPRRALLLLNDDAKNRALRTLLQQLGIDVLLAVVLLLAPLLQKANDFGDFEWKAIAFLVTKTVLATLFAWVMRRYMDGSRFPTPLPPEYPGKPNDEQPL